MLLLGLEIHSVPNQIPISAWTDGMIARDGPDAIQDTHYRWGGLGLSWNWTQPATQEAWNTTGYYKTHPKMILFRRNSLFRSDPDDESSNNSRGLGTGQ